MGSVFVHWQGTCIERSTQDELLEFLRPLAAASAARLRHPAPARPSFLDLMAARRQQGDPPVEPVRLFDGQITGRILLDPYLAPDGERLRREVEEAGTELVLIEAGGTDKQEAFVLSLDTGAAQWCLRLPRLGLRGLDFQLFDPRDLYPSANRVGFVFLDSPELPALHGCLAQIEAREQCQVYGSEVIRSADWYVSAPAIHLRHHLEEWMDAFLGAVKSLFVPNLHYHRYEPLTGYEAVQALIAEQCRERGREAAKWLVGEVLLERFEAETEEWIGRPGNMS